MPKTFFDFYDELTSKKEPKAQDVDDTKLFQSDDDDDADDIDSIAMRVAEILRGGDDDGSNHPDD